MRRLLSTPPAILLEGGRAIGPGLPCFLVAEIGNNHQGDPAVASRLIQAAAAAGAHAVKFQKRDPEAMLTRQALEAPYPGANSFGPTYGAHRRALELPAEALVRLKAEAEALGMVFFASVWDEPSLHLMVQLRVPLLKIASADLVNLPLLRRAAATGLPLAVSTGMSSWAEVDLAVAELTRRSREVVLLHCVSVYPTPEADIRLPVMPQLAQRYGLLVGYSGHEAGLGPSVAAVGLGACMVERHFTLDRSLPGTDHAASLTPTDFATLATMIREVDQALRHRDKRPSQAELAVARKLRKSVVAARDLPAGTRLSVADLTVKSPGNGLSPLEWDQLEGMILLQDVAADSPLGWSQVADPLPQPLARSQGAA